MGVWMMKNNDSNILFDKGSEIGKLTILKMMFEMPLTEDEQKSKLLIEGIDDKFKRTAIKIILSLPLTDEEKKIQNKNARRLSYIFKDELNSRKSRLHTSVVFPLYDYFWNIIEDSKANTEYSSIKQYNNLHNTLSFFTDAEHFELKICWYNIKGFIIASSSFDVLSELIRKETGLWNSASDMYLADWMIAQGKELCKDFFNIGFTAVIDYMNNNNIDYSEYSIKSISDVL